MIPLCKLNNSKTIIETILYTNPSPTSKQSAYTITLSKSIDNFDYIGFEYRANITRDERINILVTPIDIRKSNSGSGPSDSTNRPNLSICGHRYYTYYARRILYDSDTSLAIGSAYRMDTATGGENTEMAIITRIIGYK